MIARYHAEGGGLAIHIAVLLCFIALPARAQPSPPSQAGRYQIFNENNGRPILLDTANGRSWFTIGPNHTWHPMSFAAPTKGVETTLPIVEPVAPPPAAAPTDDPVANFFGRPDSPRR
jgi:hypothetical protein